VLDEARVLSTSALENASESEKRRQARPIHGTGGEKGGGEWLGGGERWRLAIIERPRSDLGIGGQCGGE